MRLARRGFVQEAETHRTIASKVLEELQRFGEIRYDNGQFWQWNGSCFHQLDKDFLYLYVANNVTRSEEHTSELQSLMRISYVVFCLKKKTKLVLRLRFIMT